MRYIPLVTALFSTLGAAAQSYDSPATVAIDRDAPRSEIVAYSTLSDALTFDRAASRYLRPVADWQEERNESGRLLTGEFTMPFAWIDRELFLHVASAGSSYEVTVNGKRAGYVQDGATPADFDITRLATEGKNRVTVTLFAPAVADALQRNPEANPALGECYVMAQPKMRVRDVVVDAALADDGNNGVLGLGIVMKTHSLNPKTTRVYYELIAPDSTKVLDGYKDLTLDMRREDTVRIMQVVPRSQMWSAGQPNLYTLIVKTRFEGRINEYVPVKVGFRTVAADKGRLLVNGEPAELRVKEFEAEPQSGELDTLRKLGYNTLRLPAGRLSRELLNRCDSLGFYVVDQLPIDTSRSGLSRKEGGNPSNDPQWLDAYLDRLDGIEVWNGRADRKNPQANAMACALAQRTAKPVTAGSDAHLPEEIGNGVVTLEADALTLPAVRAALLRGATAVDGRRGKARYVAESQLTKRRRTHAGAAAYVKWALFAAKCCLQDITWKGETYHVLDR